MKTKLKRFAIMTLAATFLCVSISALAEEIESRKLSILESSGNYTYVKKGNGREFKAIKGMGLAQGNEVITGKDSKIYIEADEDKVIRLDEDTIVEISKASAKSLNLKLRSGNLFFNVDKPLGSDEDMTFEAAHTSMSIRGTSGIFSFNPLKMEFFLVEGSVQWDLGDGNTIEINAGETIEMERDLSNVTLGPGSEVIYTFTKKIPFQWTDLNDEGLEAIMENRALLDLTAIGLDTPEEIKQAADKVEEYRKSKEPKKLSTRSDKDVFIVDPIDTSSASVQESTTNSEASYEESTLEEATTEEVTTKEPISEEATTEEATSEETTTEESTSEEVTTEESTFEEATTEEATTEEATSEEATTEEATTEEPTSEEATTEEATTEEPTSEEATTEEATTEEPTSEEATTEEPTTEEVPPEE